MAKDGLWQFLPTSHTSNAQNAMVGGKLIPAMPARVDPMRVNSPILDRRVKMLPCQKEQAVRMHQSGMSITSIGKWYQVNKRSIQFLLFPERHAKNLLDRAKRGGSKQYYNKEQHRQSMADHRQYKEELFTP